MAGLLGVSPKAVQSFEQGWRPVPAHVERQLLFLLYLRRHPADELEPCWERRQCAPSERDNCVVWEFQATQLCWFITGTLCGGEAQASWEKKMQLCRQCEVFPSLIPPIEVYASDSNAGTWETRSSGGNDVKWETSG